MRSSEDRGAGASNYLLQDDKASVNGNVTSAEHAPSPDLSTPPPESSTPAPPLSPSAPPEEDLDISVGNRAPFDYGRKLFDQLNDLKCVYIEQTTQLCNVYHKTSINDISVDDIKKCNKLQKKDLGEMLLSILNKCSYLCFDSNLDNLTTFKYDTQFENMSSELSKCIQNNLEKYSASQDARLKGIEEQINKLNSYSELFGSNSAKSSHDNLIEHSKSPNSNESANVNIVNTTLHINESIQDFVTPAISNQVMEYLNGCENLVKLRKWTFS